MRTSHPSGWPLKPSQNLTHWVRGIVRSIMVSLGRLAGWSCRFQRSKTLDVGAKDRPRRASETSLSSVERAGGWGGTNPTPIAGPRPYVAGLTIRQCAERSQDRREGAEWSPAPRTGRRRWPYARRTAAILRAHVRPRAFQVSSRSSRDQRVRRRAFGSRCRVCVYFDHGSVFSDASRRGRFATV
jgi:hypothetical protein